MNQDLVTIEKFAQEIKKMPKQRQVEIISELFDTIYSGYDNKVFRVMATAIKYAKEGNVEGHENFEMQDSDLDKLTHIQDKNRLIQQNRK